MDILVTGASGFLGRHIVRQALTEGHTVYALSRQLNAEVHPRLKLLIGDLSPNSLKSVPWGDIDAVLHLAASGVKASDRSWSSTLTTNIEGTYHLLEAIRTQAIRQPIVFHARTFYEHVLTTTPALWDNPYIATKAVSSNLVAAWAGQYQGGLVLGSFFQIYGWDDDPGNVLNYAARQLKMGRKACFGSGRGMRDWLHVDDAARAVLSAIRGTRPGSITRCDIGSGRLTSLHDMVVALAQIAEVSPDETLEFDPTEDRPDVDVAVSAMHPPVGWQPAITTAAGLHELYLKT
jgi:nucleoside-diphosphate-sugar epimerase